MTEVKSGIEGKELKKELENLINPLKGDTLKVYFTGMPLITAEISENSSKTMRLGLISAMVVLLVLYFCFRSLRGVFLPIIVSIFSSIWVLGFIALSGRSVTMIASVLPVVMISLATAYGIHFVNRYYEERHNVGIKNSVGMAIYDTSMPILMSALTTMAGFLSLSAAVLRPMTEFALFSALGMFFAFVLSIFFLGSFLTIFPPKKVHAKFSYKSNDIISRLLKLISLSVLKEKKVIIVVLSILLITSLGFGFRVRPESSIESKLGEENELVKSLTYFKENFGGTDSLYVYVTSNNVKNPYVLREIKKVEDYSKQVSGLSEPYSIADFVIQLNDAMENKKIVPASPEKIDNLWFFAGDNSYITSMIGEDNKDTLINIKVSAMSFQGLQQSIETMEQFIRNISKKVKKIEFASLQEENKLNYYNHLAVLILLILQFKSFILGLFGMIPITLTSFTSFGIMGILNIELNVATIGVASIAIGAGIDYTIHYISRYKAELTRKSKTAAMKTTLTGTGRAIIFNSISVAAGFFALNFSDIGMIGTFGNLIGSIMLISVIYALLLLPILLNTIKLKEEKKNEIKS